MLVSEHAERQVKQRCMKIERHNQTLKTNYRTETNEKDRAQEEQEELERQLEVLEASKAANLQAMNEVPPPRDILRSRYPRGCCVCV